MAARRKKTVSVSMEFADWASFNTFMKAATEEQAAAFMKQESKTRRRRTHWLRAHSRFNKMRAARERREITEQSFEYREAPWQKNK